MKPRTFLLAGLTLGMLASACGSGDDTAGPVGPDATSGAGGAVDLNDDDITLTAGLVPFGSCDDTLAWLRAQASERVGPWGLDGLGGYPYPGPVPLAVEEAAVAAEGDAAAAGDRGPVDGAATPEGTSAPGDASSPRVTGTNTQEAGVDEPDLVKTDGRRIVTLTNGTLRIVDVTGDAPVVVGSVQLSEWGFGQELFLSGDRAFVFTNEGGYWVGPLVEGDVAREVSPDIFPGSGTQTVRIFEVDLANAGIVRTLQVEGQYLTARSVGSTARVVVRSTPTSLPFVYPSGPAAEESARVANQSVVENSTLDDWLPNFRLTEADGTITNEGVLNDCARVSHPGTFSGFATVSILTFDLGAALTPGAAAGIIADGDTVYASEANLYLATNRWYDPAIVQPQDGSTPAPVEDYSTAIHKFSIQGTEPASYLASGVVEGHLLNQFSLDEHDGNLRVVTTDGAPWGDQSSESFLVVLGQDGESLVPLGRVGNLGKGERVYSVRLVGPRGYVVTFRQVDPLYVLDLADPANPTVQGELKIPGYSSYLHPLSDTLVLGIGQDGTDDGRILGAKASLFDVSDPANPREVGVWTMANAYSAVESEHRAFQYLADQGLAILPVDAWDAQFVGAVVLKVDDGTLVEVGRISHLPDGAAPTSDCTIPAPEDIPTDSPLYYQVTDGYSVVQICDADDVGGYGPSYYCEQITDPASYFGGTPEQFPVSDGQRLEICYPNGNPYGEPILRTLVIDATIWSVSSSRLQANAVDGFAVTGQVQI
jgi:hypothetical protein